MKRRFVHFAILAASLAPMVAVSVQQQQNPPAQEPKCEEVFQNIISFKGVPSSDLIPAMEFMAASLGYQCDDCHNPGNYAQETRGKEVARKMIAMQKDINAKNFNGRNEVTCMSCHNGGEHPASAPIPEGLNLRHERMENPPKAEDLFAKFSEAVGKGSGAIVRTGTLTAPEDATHKEATKPLEFIQTADGKFRIVSGDRKVGSNGKETWYGTMAMGGEPAAVFSRIGRSWREETIFSELQRPTVSGKDKVGKIDVVVVRATRPSTTSTEELYFDVKTGLLVRMTNIKRSSLGSVVTMIDYSNYKDVGGVKVPMKVVTTFAGGEKWAMDFKSAKKDDKVDESVFKIGG